jgi:CIC family chloride channel protein
VGLIGGVVNALFFLAIEQVQRFFLRRPGDLVEIAEMISPWERALIPALGGLAAGLVLHFGLRLAGRQGGTSNLLEVVVAGDGKLPFRGNAIRASSSLVSIGTGASIGREGAITQLTATLASKWGQMRKWPPYRLRLLVGCGAASGIAAAYNAPIAGAVFAALVVLGNFSMNLFAPLVFSSVVAAVVSRSFFGISPWYNVAPYEFTSILQLPWFVLLGALTGFAGAVFLKMIQRAELRYRQLGGPIYLKLALAGALVGLIAVVFPGVWGNGYVITNRVLQGRFDELAAPWLYGGMSPGFEALLFLVASQSMSNLLPHTNPPEEPSALLSVPMRIATARSTSGFVADKYSTTPRPCAPHTPVACASSTNSIASCSIASAAICGSGARSPSMLKIVSVAMSRRRN